MSLLRRFATRKREEEERAESKVQLRLEEIEELLEQGYFLRAYQKAAKALEDGNDKERCLRILGAAAYGMRKWELSVRHYEELLHAFPSNEHVRDRLLAALARLAEERTGNYDFGMLYKADLAGEMDVDVADYVGPIEVVDIPGKGKGIVATRDIKKGTLLLVSKAFAIATSFNGLLNAIEEKLGRQPERIAEVAGLYYGCERHAATPRESDGKIVIDRNRLVLICSYNTFQIEPFSDAPEPRADQGIWILPSFFNHSCLENAGRTFYGDVMTVFALADVKQGEELTLSYVPLMDSYEHRKSGIAAYDVVCDCRLCELDREDPRCKEREQLAEGTVEKFMERPHSAQEAIPVLTRVMDQISESYADRPEDLKTQLYWPLETLAIAYQAKREHAESVKYLLEAVKCIPECAMPIKGVWAYAQMAESCDSMRRPRTARRYARMAADLHRTSTGHDDELFKKIYTDIAHLL
ncbi:TPR domain protein [Aphelenchoides avenae]|nr:TPR domain protein [Aphelenchus avenae]